MMWKKPGFLIPPPTKLNIVYCINQLPTLHQILRVLRKLNWKVSSVNNVHDEGNESCFLSKSNYLKRNTERRRQRRKEENWVEAWHLLEQPAACARTDSFTAQREGIHQRASLVLLNFFGGSLGWEGKTQKLRSGFWGPRDGVCGLTGIDLLRNLAEEEERLE